jgi:hypothetical protein
MRIFFRLIVLLLFFAVAPAYGQKPVRDTVKEKNDDRYNKLKQYSGKRKFTKFIHKLIFRPVREKKAGTTRKDVRLKSPELLTTYERFEGKPIRKIVVQTLDPFGYSINDTVSKAKNWAERTGNKIHLRTKEFTVRNLLLFGKHETLDSLKVKESERLLRSQRYIRQVVIKPEMAPGSADSVDVYVRVLDAWSLIPNGSASTSSTSFQLTERNFMGLGHQFENDFDKRFNTGETDYLARYTVPNLFNSYINTSVAYQIQRSDNWVKSAGVERNFFSTLTKWAGGVYVESRFLRDSLPNLDGRWGMQNFKSDSQDYWAGYAFQLFKGWSVEDRTTRLVTTGRFYNRSYKETPTVDYDPIGYFSSEKLYLASIGITSRKFVQDKFLYNYGIVEDIPIGKVYSGTFGMQDKNNEHRLYLGARYAFGNYYKWGYFSTNFELGSFFYKDYTQQTTMRIEALYFTNIRYIGRWRTRHFIKPVLVFGDNRMPIYSDQLTINDQYGIAGFSSGTLKGTKKALLTLQTQAFSPFDVVGFRINPFVNATLGVIGDEDHKLYKSDVYAKFGVGIMLYNDYLVFNSFQLSFAYYPNIPGNGYNIFKTNAIQNTDIVLPDFQIDKPEVVPYN